MRALILAGVAVVAACASSSEPAQAQAQAAPAAVQQYTLDPQHTQIGFSVDRFGFNNVLGRFDQVTGEVTLDAAHPASSMVHAVVQIANLSSGDPTRDQHLKGPNWLRSQMFPTMEYRSTAVRVIDSTHAEVTGDLTLLGQTHPLTLNVTLNHMGVNPASQRPSAGFSARGTLSRAAWGLATAPNLIGDQVSITIEALGSAPAAGN